MLGWIALIIGMLVLLGICGYICWHQRKTIKSLYKKNKKKVAAIAVASAAIGAGTTQFIIPEGYRPNTATMISNSNGKYWSFDGVANIQAAIWDLNGTGGWVELPAGNVTLTNGTVYTLPIKIPSNVWLRGQGNDTVLYLAANSNCVMIENNDIIDYKPASGIGHERTWSNGNGNSDIRISDMVIDGNGANQVHSRDNHRNDLRCVIYMRDVDDITIENCVVKDSPAAPNIYIWCGDNIKILDNTVSGAGADLIMETDPNAVGIWFDGVNDSIVNRNTVFDCHADGIVMEKRTGGVKTRNVTITSNVCYDNFAGIWTENSENITISNNVCNGNGRTNSYAYAGGLSYPGGIYLGRGTRYNTVTNNICNNNGNKSTTFEGYGISISGTDHIISNNIFDNNDLYGINLGADNVTITGNIVSSSGKQGMKVQGDNLLIAYNKIFNCGDDGIYSLGSKSNNSFIGNQIKHIGGAGDGIRTSDNDCIISDNIIYDTEQYGIYSAGNNCTISGNLIIDATFDGIKLNVAWHCVVTGNNIKLCAEGIEVDDSYFCSIGMNVVPNGISETGSADYNSFVGNVCYPDTVSVTGGNSVEVGSIE